MASVSPSPILADLPAMSYQPKGNPSLNEHLPPSHTQALLSNILTSPSLLLATPEASPFDTSTLQSPSPLPQLRSAQKLGHLYEDALASILEQDSQINLLARNIQVQEDKHRTVGEIDFLLEDYRTDEIIHLELAAKFYLAYQRNDGQWIYPGPNSNDSWQSKLARLRSHQFVISQNPSAQVYLKNILGSESRPITQHLVHGRLFRPIDGPIPPLPEFAAPSTRWAPWLKCHQWHHHFSQTEPVFYLPKHLWGCHLSPSLFQTLPLLQPLELMKFAKERCTMFTTKQQFEPHFLVPDQWMKPHI